MKNLSQCLLFANMNSNEIEQFLKDTNSYYKTYPKESHVLMHGDPVKNISVIISGKVIIYKLDSNGNNNVIAKLAENDFFGPALLLHSRDALSSVEAISECNILHIPNSNLDIQTKEVTKFFKNLVTAIATKNVELNNKVMLLGIKNLSERIITYLKLYEEQPYKPFTIPYNKQQLANYLLVDRSTLSRELAKLKKRGLIDFNKNTYTIKKS